jgi:hypothetical protein
VSKDQKPSNHEAESQATPLQASDYWKAVGNHLAAVVTFADQYLPIGDGVMDPDTAREIRDALESASTAVDMAYGRYHRISLPEREAVNQRVTELQQPAVPVPTGQPRYAPQGW